jgi:hypothetical protein
MAKKALSVTLDETNVLWLRGQMAGRRSLSEVLDSLVRGARLSGWASPASVRSIVGTIDLAADDPDLTGADEFLRAQFAQSLHRPVLVREHAPAVGSGGRRRPRHRPRKTRRG